MGDFNETGFGSPGTYASQAPEASKQVVTGKGVIGSIFAENKNAAVRYVFVFDGIGATGVIIGGPYAIASHTSVQMDSLVGVKFSTGLFLGLSDTDANFNLAAADAWFNVAWRGL